MPSKVQLQVELVEKNAEARLKALDKLAKEMGNRKITINFDEASLQKWKTATDGMSAAQINAWAKIATAVEKTTQTEITAANRTQTAVVQAEAKKVQATERTAQERIKADAKIEAAEIKATASARKHSAAVTELGTEANKTSGIFNTLTARFTAANLISTLITRSMAALKQAVREANEELKKMDKELTTIKMVSGASDSYINQLTEQAFAGARANGRNVTDYLSAAEIFTRAGYRDNIDQLSQLALMTENIGGVEEEVASKFLLAADAAWKLGGSYEALLGVLDGVSSVADQNATDLGKIAEGITVAGSAFANAGESAATFTAMLGVTTASTQRSGSEMARGLRTILFRVRQVKAEFDDGEIVDAKSISNAAKALEDVGISVRDETGDMKSMSRIMTELSAKWGTLTKAQQSYLQNYLAGNRNGNVLFALMDNWGQYEKMLQQYEDSAGTAIEKNAIYTDSWAAATEKLKTSWTELMATVTANGELQKSFVEGLSDFVASVNALLEWSKRNSGASTTGFGAITNGINDQALAYEKAKEAADKYQERGKKLTDALKGETDAIVEHTEATNADTDAVEESTNAFVKQRNAIDEVKKAINSERDDAVSSLADIYKAMNEAAEKGYYGSNAFQKGGALFFSEDVLKDIRSGKNNPIKDAMDAYIEGIKGGDYSNSAAKLFSALTDGSNKIKSENGELLASVKDIGDAYEWTFNKGEMGMDDYLKSLSASTGISESFWASMIESLGMYSDEMAEWVDNNGEVKTEAEFESSGASSAIEEYRKLIASIPPEVVTIVRTIYESGTTNTGAAYSASKAQADGYKLTQKYQHKATGKHDRYSGIALVNDEFPADGSKPELIISNSTGRAYIANGGYPALVNLSANDTVLTASETKKAFGVPGFAMGTYVDLSGGGVAPFVTTISKDSSGSGSGGGGGGSAAAADPTGTWNTLKKLVDYLLDKGEEDLKDQLKVLDDQLAELEAERKAQEESNKLQEKQEAVQQALLDLEKAQVERTVRYYNEETQQWEWMADQGAVQKAQEAYDEALKDLNEYLADQDYEARKAEIQARKEELQAQFDAYKDSWSAIIDAIEAPAGDIKALLEEVKKYGTSTMVAQSGGIADLLNNLRDGLVRLGYVFGLGNINANTTNSGTNENTVFDSGGFAFGSGLMRKGAVGAEAVIGPDITRDILNPVRNANFATFADSVRTLIGASNMIAGSGSSYITNNSGGNIYVNGMKIGEDMMQKPFAEVMRTISLHVNEAV